MPDDIELVLSIEPSKKRKLDMGELMVRSNVTKRVGSRKPLSQFKAPKRPEITRLPPIDDTETGTMTMVKVLGKGSGKDGRPLVADLIRLCENESKLVQELVNEKARAQAQLQAALAAQDQIYETT